MFNKSTVIIQSPLLYDEEMKVFLPPEQVYPVSNGIQSKNYTHFAYDNPNKIPVILFVSAIAKMKGPLVLLEALDVINKKNINFKAIFIGAPLDITAEEFNSLIKKYNLTYKVKYLGMVSHEIKSKYFTSSDIFIQPTLNDAFPLTILEAMEAGLPTISTIEGAIPEIIDNNITGYLVPKYDIQELADKIEILIKNRQLRVQMGHASREKFLKTYTLEVFENNLKKIFDQVCYDNKK